MFINLVFRQSHFVCIGTLSIPKVKTNILAIFQWQRQLYQNEVQKHPPEVFFKKRSSQKFSKIYRKIPVPESIFVKVADISLKLYLKRGYGTDVSVKFLRKPFYNTSLGACFQRYFIQDSSLNVHSYLDLFNMGVAHHLTRGSVTTSYWVKNLNGTK